MVNMEPVEASQSRPPTLTVSRETLRPDHLPKALAARALLATPDGTQQRVSDLLGVSRRTIGRLAEADFSAALRDKQVLDDARTYLQDTASRGSTAAERAAAAAWLEEAAREEHQVPVTQAATKPVVEHHVERTPAATTPPVSSPVVNPTPRGLARRPDHTTARRNASTPSPATTLPVEAGTGVPTPEPLPPIDALRRQQQRILHRSALIDYVLAAEKRGGETVTMGDALAELLADITEAARTIGTILQTATWRL
jgi:hypothetical protein